MKRELFDIWEEPVFISGQKPPWIPPYAMPWKAQMVNYVGNFSTRENAETFVASVKKSRAQEAKAVK